MSNNPRELGISFTPEMLAALRDNRKTQTRRVAKMGKKMVPHWDRAFVDGTRSGDEYLHVPCRHVDDGPDGRVERVYCRYTVGQRLYVREGICINPFDGPTGDTFYKDGTAVMVSGKYLPWRWKPNSLSARFMPKVAARDWLVVTQIRAQRVQEITYGDVCAEGWNPPWEEHYTNATAHAVARAWFIALWDSINAKRKPVYGSADDLKQISSYVSHPWSLETLNAIFPDFNGYYRGKTWLAIPNPWTFAITFRRGEA